MDRVIVKVDVWDVCTHRLRSDEFTAWRVCLNSGVVESVGGHARGETFELHYVRGQRARLVREDVLYLAELLVDVGALSAAAEVLIRVVHIHVHVHERALEELDHLKCHEE